jgi:hypothetical protein
MTARISLIPKKRALIERPYRTVSPTFANSKRSGGRDIKKDAAKPPFGERAGWSRMRKQFGMPDHLMFRAVALTLRARLQRREAHARKRAALIKVGFAAFFLNAAATPPVPGGELRVSDSVLGNTA